MRACVVFKDVLDAYFINCLLAVEYIKANSSFVTLHLHLTTRRDSIQLLAAFMCACQIFLYVIILASFIHIYNNKIILS